MKKTNIYVLIDPRNKEKKYIGKSNNPNKRFKEHIYKTRYFKKKGKRLTKKQKWIWELLQQNLEPILKIIHKPLLQEYEYWEEYYIKKLKKEGCELVNGDDTGRGIVSIRKKTAKKTKKVLSKKIIQFDLNGKKIKEFNSLREAEKMTGINHGNISKTCSGIYKHSGGFIFKFAHETNNVEPVINPNAMLKEVVEIDSDGKVIAEFISIMEASRVTGIDNGNISRVCNKKRKMIKNRYFKFKNQ